MALVLAVQCWGAAKAHNAVLAARATAADSVARVDAARYALLEAAAREAAAHAQRAADSVAAAAVVAERARELAERQAVAATTAAARLRDSLLAHPVLEQDVSALSAALASAAAAIKADSGVIHGQAYVIDSLSVSQQRLLLALAAADTTIVHDRMTIVAYQHLKTPGPYWTPLRITGAILSLAAAGAVGHGI